MCPWDTLVLHLAHELALVSAPILSESGIARGWQGFFTLSTEHMDSSHFLIVVYSLSVLVRTREGPERLGGLPTYL